MSLEFRCQDVGAACGASIKADSEDGLIAKIAEHADRKHNVANLSDTLVDYARSKVTSSSEKASS